MNVGDEGAHTGSVFAGPENGEAAIVGGGATAAPRGVGQPVPGRAIDLRWWLAAFTLGACLWAMILAV